MRLKPMLYPTEFMAAMCHLHLSGADSTDRCHTWTTASADGVLQMKVPRTNVQHRRPEGTDVAALEGRPGFFTRLARLFGQPHTSIQNNSEDGWHSTSRAMSFGRGAFR